MKSSRLISQVLNTILGRVNRKHYLFNALHLVLLSSLSLCLSLSLSLSLSPCLSLLVSPSLRCVAVCCQPDDVMTRAANLPSLSSMTGPQYPPSQSRADTEASFLWGYTVQIYLPRGQATASKGTDPKD